MRVLGSHREEQAYAAAVVLAGGLMGYLFVGDFGLRQSLLGVPPAPAITIDVPKVRIPFDPPGSRPSRSDRRPEDGVTVPGLDAQPSSAPEPIPVARSAPSPGPSPGPGASPSASPVPVPPPQPSEEPRPTQEPPDDDPAEDPDDDDGPNNPKNSSGGNPKPHNNNNKPGPKPGPKPG